MGAQGGCPERWNRPKTAADLKHSWRQQLRAKPCLANFDQHPLETGTLYECTVSMVAPEVKIGTIVPSGTGVRHGQMAHQAMATYLVITRQIRLATIVCTCRVMPTTTSHGKVYDDHQIDDCVKRSLHMLLVFRGQAENWLSQKILYRLWFLQSQEIPKYKPSKTIIHPPRCSVILAQTGTEQQALNQVVFPPKLFQTRHVGQIGIKIGSLSCQERDKVDFPLSVTF